MSYCGPPRNRHLMVYRCVEDARPTRTEVEDIAEIMPLKTDTPPLRMITDTEVDDLEASEAEGPLLRREK